MSPVSDTLRRVISLFRAGHIAALLIIISGIVWLFLGLSGVVQLDLTLGPLHGKLTDASPGVAMMLLGVALMAYYRPKRLLREDRTDISADWIAVERDLQRVQRGEPIHNPILKQLLEQIPSELSPEEAIHRITRYVELQKLIQKGGFIHYSIAQQSRTELRFPPLMEETPSGQFESSANTELQLVQLRSLLPLNETATGEYLPFSGIIVVKDDVLLERRHFNRLSKTKVPVVARDRNGNPLHWDYVDAQLSVVRHELTHFYQSLVSPIVPDSALSARVVYTSFLDALAAYQRTHCKITLPITVRVSPVVNAFNAIMCPDPTTGLTSQDLFEAVAIYHQFNLWTPRDADPAIRIATEILKRGGTALRAYWQLYHDFVSDFGDNAYDLFPLVAWTALLCLENENQARFTPQTLFVILNEWLLDNVHRQLQFCKPMRGGMNPLEIWESWRNAISKDLSLHFLSQNERVDATIEAATHLATAVRPGLDPRYFFPPLENLRRIPKDSDYIVAVALRLFSNDMYTDVFDAVGWPTMVGERQVLLPADHPHNSAPQDHIVWQMNWHLMERFLRRAMGQPVSNDCPYEACPLYKVALCTGHRPFPSTHEECNFHTRAEHVLGVKPELFEYDGTKSHGAFSYDLNTGESTLDIN